MKANQTLSEEQVLSIHNALHSKCNKIELEGSTYNLLDSKYHDKVRYVHVGEWKFLTQNPEKKSYYGFKAKAGSEITWIVYPEKIRSWGMIENGVVVKY